MARIRTIKPAFFRHAGLFDAEQDTGLPLRVAYAGLWTACDRAGRFKWSPRELKLDCLPFDDVDFSRVLDALATRGFIRKYTVDSVVFGCIPSWEQHQVINNRETASEIPGPQENPDESTTSTREARVDDASGTRHGNYQGEGEGKGKGIKDPPTPRKRGECVSEGFAEFWKAYPPTVRKAAKQQCWDKWRRRELDPQAAQIVAHVKAMSASEAWRKDGGAFVPAPLVYLNQSRFEAPTESQVAATNWRDSRSGIEAKGEALGLGRWDEYACSTGKGEPFKAYERRVVAAAECHA